MAIINFILGDESVGGGYTGVFLIPSGGPAVANTPMNHRMAVAEATSGGDFAWINPGGQEEAMFFFTSIAGEPNVVTWGSGSWDIRLQIITASANVTWESIRVCRINSAGTEILETIGTNTSVNLSCGVDKNTVLGPISVTVSESSGPASDRVHIVLGFTSNHSSRNRRLSIAGEESQTTTIDDDPGGGTDIVNAEVIALTSTVEAADIQNLAPIEVDAFTIALQAIVEAASPGIDVTVAATAIALTATVEDALVSAVGETVQVSTIEITATVEAATIQAAIVVGASVIELTSTVEAAIPSGGAAIFKVFDGANYILIGGTE